MKQGARKKKESKKRKVNAHEGGFDWVQLTDDLEQRGKKDFFWCNEHSAERA